MTNCNAPSKAATLCGIFVLSLAALASAHGAQAADASNWDKDGYSSLRLLGGSKAAAGTAQQAGVELEIMSGWKTYWRYPGDSGVPPEFDFSASENVADVRVEWPAPKAFPDGSGGNAIGYKGGVVFPLRVTAKDAAAPVVLRVMVHYAVCEKLCVPAVGKAELTLPQNASASDAALAEAQAHVPHRVERGASAPLAVQSLQIEKSTGKPRVLVDVNATPGEHVSLFVEGPNERWALPIPEPVAGAPAGQQRFAFLLDGVPKNAPVSGATLLFTAVGPASAAETAVPLD
jgi:DsbC/DsbD-like thiol-disulfide interchange protein